MSANSDDNDKVAAMLMLAIKAKRALLVKIAETEKLRAQMKKKLNPNLWKRLFHSEGFDPDAMCEFVMAEGKLQNLKHKMSETEEFIDYAKRQIAHGNIDIEYLTTVYTVFAKKSRRGR